MDRFIEGIELNHPKLSTRLKSNMDRFIAISISPLATGGGCLKSNMDRFIEALPL